MTRIIKGGTQPFTPWEPPVLTPKPQQARSYWCPPAENEWALVLAFKAIGFAVSLLIIVALSIR